MPIRQLRTICAAAVWVAILVGLQPVHVINAAESVKPGPPAPGTATTVHIYVNNQTGDDENPGTKSQPMASASRALRKAKQGDTIHLLPPGAIYRETLTFNNKTGVVIEGNGCTVSGADPLPADLSKWEAAGPELHRMQIRRTSGDRYILVVNGKGNRMGRNKQTRGDLASQFPPLDRLQAGEFRVEPIDNRTAWLYVKGSVENLEWSVRQQGVTTGGRVKDITIRDLNARHALNDGFGLHSDAQNLVLINVEGSENYDNGVSPHGGCSMIVENGNFRENGTPAWAQGDATETIFRRCEASGSEHQWAVVFAGGVHRVEDSTIRLNGNELWFVHWKPRAFALKEIELAGKNPNVRPEYVVRGTQVIGDPARKGTVKIGEGVKLTLEDCSFSNVTFDVDPAATVSVIGSTVDGQPLVIPHAKQLMKK